MDARQRGNVVQIHHAELVAISLDCYPYFTAGVGEVYKEESTAETRRRRTEWRRNYWLRITKIYLSICQTLWVATIANCVSKQTSEILMTSTMRSLENLATGMRELYHK